jgi:beta-glucosidase-like glycosyl hydrolase
MGMAVHAVQAMVPFHEEFVDDGVAAVKQGYVDEARIDIAVERMLALKHRVGLLSPNNPPAPSRSAAQHSEAAAATCGGGTALAERGMHACGPPVEKTRQQEVAESEAAAVEGIVLLKNEGNVLPLTALEDGGDKGRIISVVGPSADCAANLVGGWSIHWLGPESEAEVRHCCCCCCCLKGCGCPQHFDARKLPLHSLSRCLSSRKLPPHSLMVSPPQANLHLARGRSVCPMPYQWHTRQPASAQVA